MFRIDVYHHLVFNDSTEAKFDEALVLLRGIKHQGEKTMATQQEILDKLAAATASLDGIQADILALKDLVASGADLTAISDAVNALADKAAGIDSQT